MRSFEILKAKSDFGRVIGLVKYDIMIATIVSR